MTITRNIRQGGLEDLKILVPLFDSYRQFYRQPSDPEGAGQFLRERLEQHQSIVFLAMDGGCAVGFTQLYPSFSSAAMARIFILNDLFVTPGSRCKGTGSALLQHAAEWGKSMGAIRLSLSTELTNVRAQSVYERLGWKRG